jgi:uncharacterized protein
VALTTYLLDVNVLLALSDPVHVHYERAGRWFEAASRPWATCPITENGFVRISSNPNYGNPPGGIDAALAFLDEQRKLPGWEFWGDEVSILEILEPTAAIARSQLTDLYLLGLAAHNGGKLATLDGRINAGAVRGGREALELIAP